LDAMRNTWPDARLLITVPNALSHAGLRHAQKGIEHVNVDHVAWYSYRTLRTLVERCGYGVADFKWYGGVPMFSEGLIFLCERQTDECEIGATENQAGESL